MGRKKTVGEPKLGVVKIDKDLITKAKMIAADKGESVAGYLSNSMRTIIDRDWSKVVRKAGEGE
jgi:hypothetical protein